MICDMELAGYTQGTQQSYIGAVVKLQDHYTIRPDKLTEKQVLQYIFWLRDEKKVAKGTFQTRSSHAKKSANPCANGYRCPLPGRMDTV